MDLIDSINSSAKIKSMEDKEKKYIKILEKINKENSTSTIKEKCKLAKVNYMTYYTIKRYFMNKEKDNNNNAKKDDKKISENTKKIFIKKNNKDNDNKEKKENKKIMGDTDIREIFNKK